MIITQAKSVSILERILDPPHYGWTREGVHYVPTSSEIFKEFFSRLNFLKERRTWLPFFGWSATLLLCSTFFIFIFKFFSWPSAIAGFFYGMVVLGSHGTFWLHRYCTHGAFKFSHPWIRDLCRNLTPRIIPEEIYVVSHHVHHRLSEKAGDPYNVFGGWLYCFLSDANHQSLGRDLSELDYRVVQNMMKDTGVNVNSYSQYQYWGTACHPVYATLHYLINWSFWYGCFYLLGGHALATALFGFAGVWAIGVRSFNYDGHGGGKDKRREGIDFNREDFSVNQTWPGYVSGEWHNNHHLYPNGARAGFLSYQLDLPWYFIMFLKKIGAAHTVRDYKDAFIREHLNPYRDRVRQAAAIKRT